MKRIATLFVILALCMGLAVPAFAAEYGPVTIGGDPMSTVTFSAAKLGEPVEIGWDDGDGNIQYSTYIPVILQPGSQVTVGEGYPLSYAVDYILDDGTASSGAIVYDFVTGPVETLFDRPCPEDCSLFVNAFYMSTEYWFKLDDGSSSATPEQPTAPVAPVEPETPETPVAPVEPETPVAPVAPVEPETPVAPVAPGTYTVQKGDTLGLLSVNYYGSYAYHSALYKANAEAFKKTGGMLVPGMVLTLPETLGKAVRIAPPAADEGETLYTVRAGDTLGAIAKTTYGDVMKYKAIFERNSDRLKDANTIYEGQIIVLPAK